MAREFMFLNNILKLVCMVLYIQTNIEFSYTAATLYRNSILELKGVFSQLLKKLLVEYGVSMLCGSENYSCSGLKITCMDYTSSKKHTFGFVFF